MDELLVAESSAARVDKNYYTIRYGLVGFAFGLIFPILATAIDLYLSSTPFSLSTIIEAYRNEPLHWIIFTAPFFLGFFAALIGRREDRLQQVNRKLESIIGKLEVRVSEQARDLDRAVEVGHSVSRVTNSYEMMSEAVELIRSSFNFYYVQLYLVDSSRRNLELQVGSGNLDTRMIAQGRRIPLGLNSIAGTAVIEKQTIVVADVANSLLFQHNPLLPDASAEMAMPLILGTEVIGVLDILSDSPGQLTTESLPALEAVAGQLAIAIENARLVVESTKAHNVIEIQTRRMAHSGWKDFLNAIDRREIIGYKYESNELSEIDQPLLHQTDNAALSVPILVTGEQVGSIQIQGRDGNALSKADAEMVAAVADQVARQVESLRLLAEADHYRDEAEEITRRLTREGWQDFVQTQQPQSRGFDYDLVKVKPLSTPVDRNVTMGSVLSQSLAIRGQSIGYLEIAEFQYPEDDTSELLGAIANQLSAHIDNIRLSDQRARALADSEKQARRLAALNELSQALATSTTFNEIYRITALNIKQIIPCNRISLAFINDEGTSFVLFALGGQKGASKIGDMATGPGSVLGDAVAENRVIVINNNIESGVQGIESFMIAPLTAGGQTFGTLNVGNSSPDAFDQQDEGLLLQIASLVAATFESRRLFLETQERAEELAEISYFAQTRADELAILNQMGQELTSLADIKSVMTSVHRHVGRLMDIENFYLAIYDKSLDMVEIHMFGEGEETDPSSVKRQGGKGIAEYVITTNQALLIENNVAERVTELGLELYGRVAESWVGAPMTSGHQVIGMMAVQNYSKPGIYGEHERELLTAVANQTAIAIENSNLFEQEQARSRREQILRQITAKVRGSTDVDTVMRTAAQEVGRALGRQAFVYLSDGEEENTHESNDE